MMFIQPEITLALVRVLEEDRASDRLVHAISRGRGIDLSARRSAEAAAHDGQSPTVAGYLLGLIRDKFSNGIRDWDEFVALGALAADIEAAAQA
jgi:hypothetical protein